LTPTTTRFGARAAVVILAVLGLSALFAAPAGAVVSSTADETWMTNGRVSAVLAVGDRVYIGGTFTRLRSPGGTQTVVRNNAAAVNRLTGVVDPDWNPNANGEVAALASDGIAVFAGGTFTAIGGAANTRLAALDPVTGTAVPGWRAGANAKVYSLAAAGGRVYAGGSFTSVNNGNGAVTRLRLAAFNAATGQVDADWRPSANAYVRAVEMSADRTRVFAGGSFTTVSGTTHRMIVAVHAVTGAVDGAFTADGQYLIFDLAVTADGTTVFAATGGPGGRVNAFNTTGGRRTWAVYARGDVQAVAVDGTTVYAGGHFSGAGEFAGQDRWRLAAVDNTNDGRLESGFVPRLSGQVWALATTPGELYVGGDFVRINGRVQQGFAIFSE
jgi:hypothetical protein